MEIKVCVQQGISVTHRRDLRHVMSSTPSLPRRSLKPVQFFNDSDTATVSVPMCRRLTGAVNNLVENDPMATSRREQFLLDLVDFPDDKQRNQSQKGCKQRALQNSP